MPEERKQKPIKKENDNPIRRSHRNDESEVDDMVDELEDILDETRERQGARRKSGE